VADGFADINFVGSRHFNLMRGCWRLGSVSLWSAGFLYVIEVFHCC
jgi:hypothetical protein